jgi:HSP20 family molecular chaperone IbpA
MSNFLPTISGLKNINSFIGFDDLFDELVRFDHHITEDVNTKYPPYNIYTQLVNVAAEGEGEITQKHTFIEVACAGFSKDELTASFDDEFHTLTVASKTAESTKSAKTDDDYEDKDANTSKYSKQYSHKGIGSRSFAYTWKLEKDLEFVKATYVNGILTIELRPKYHPDTAMKELPIE